MPLRFDRYRMRDQVTRLGEQYFNGVFRDIDVRIASLEELRLSWDEAVRTVTQFGLERIDSVMLEPLQALETSVSTGQNKTDEIEALRLAAVAAVDSLSQTIASLQASTEAGIDAWKAERLADLNAWMAALTVALPQINQRMDQLEAADLELVQKNQALEQAIADLPQEVVSAAAPAAGLTTLLAGDFAGQLIMVDGYGVYAWDAASTAAADGEICVAPPAGAGRWWLVAPAWDFIWSRLVGLLDDVQGQLDAVDAPAVETALAAFTTLQGTVNTLTGNLAALAAKTLTASANIDFPAIAAGASQTLFIAVAGAAVGDRVVLTPPSTLPNGLVPVAYIQTDGQVVVRLNNVTAAAIDPASMAYLLTVMKA